MDVFARGPLGLAQDPSGCRATITSRTAHSGDTKLVFTLDPATNAVTGAVSRTKFGENNKGDTVPAAGRRDVGPIAPGLLVRRHVVFDRGTIKGVAKTAHYEVFEDGNAGENLWGTRGAPSPRHRPGYTGGVRPWDFSTVMIGR